jgi:predicted TIM-barrel fold metal-dependent hydrolase
MWFDAPLLPLSPSEYFRRQGFVACDGDEGSLAGVTLLGWEDHVVWNTDYPHPDAPAPEEPVPNMLEQPISEESKRKILWDNSVGLYGPRLLSGRN